MGRLYDGGSKEAGDNAVGRTFHRVLKLHASVAGSELFLLALT